MAESAAKAIPTPASVAVAEPMARLAMPVVQGLTPSPSGSEATAAAVARIPLEPRSFSLAAVEEAMVAAAAMAEPAAGGMEVGGPWELSPGE